MTRNSTTRSTRRTVLKMTGGLIASGIVGTASAHPSPGGDSENHAEGIRLFSEQAVNGTTEVVTQNNYVYAATGSGMAVVDGRNPGRPELVATLTANDPAGGILDVKVDGNLASLASNGGPGVTLVDISTPTDPQEVTFYRTGHSVHNNFLADGYAYLTINESDEAPFSEARTDIIDISDPTSPEKVGEFRLSDHFPAFAAAGVNPCHDIYVQGDFLYQAFWDAGVVIADISDPTDPTLVTQFGDAPGADTPLPSSSRGERYLTLPGNAHYVQPSPDGQYVYVGAETFPGGYVENPDNDDYGGISVFDVSDYDAPQQVARIEPPEIDVFRTSHNFDVTNNQLHASWYNGGVTLHDITDPANPTELGHYAAEGSSFWTAVRSRGFTVAGDIGGGVVFLHPDEGTAQPPAFDGDERPTEPEIEYQ
ncbi:hypothetical protein DMJ13_17810 [halophilic archaeon]|nr:hypothetical protein DMJ13_17810 [halophilic archaeon]